METLGRVFRVLGGFRVWGLGFLRFLGLGF